jgi:hypothetical protein
MSIIIAENQLTFLDVEKQYITVKFDVCRNMIDSWPHLGHIINSDLNDAKDIQSRCRSVIWQINNTLCFRI